MNKSLERIEQQIHRFAEMMYHMGYDDGMEAEAVHRDLCEEEREPILDKIRAEIDRHCSDNRDRNDGLYIAMKIIDKYKAESEE